jgi:membrane associated rhomboid family serine protease
LIPIKDNIPTDRFPLVTVCLILANVVVYVLAVAHGGSLFSGPDTHELVKYGVSPYQITHPTGRTWETVFTAMFLQASILHLAGNMLFLWIFGNNVEDSTGRLRFLAFYVLGGLAALVLQVAVGAGGSESLAPTVGAEGAIAAVLGGYIVMYPHARVLTLVLIILLFTVIEIPAMVMVGLWFALQAVFGAAGLTDPTGGGGAVAYFTSVGGFVFGLLAIRAVATRRKAVPPTAASYR